MNQNAKKRYDRDFKLGAVRLVVDEGRSVAEVAKDLGITDKSLYNWVAAYKSKNKKEDLFVGSGNLSSMEAELKRLREEVRILRMERDLLKKTLPIFAEKLK